MLKKNIGPQKGFIIDIKNQLEENKDDSDKIIIQLSSTTIEIHYYQLCKYSCLIREEYLKNDVQMQLSSILQSFQTNNNIKEENINIFFRIIKEERVEITSDRYYDLFVLSKKFKVNLLQKILENYSNENMKDINFIINSILNADQHSNDENIYSSELISEMETILSNQINNCLQNELFERLPVPTITRIVEKSLTKEKFDTNLLYKFISKSIDERFILFSYVNIENLSNENFENLFENYLQRKGSNSENFFQYFPVNFEYIHQLIEKQKLIDDQLNKIKSENNEKIQLQIEIDKLTEENKQISQLQFQVEDLKDENEQLKKQIQEYVQKGKIIPRRIVKKQRIVQKPDQVETNEQKKPIENEFNIEVMKAILSNYEKQIQSQNTGKTLLHLGCESQNIQVVKYILSLKNVDVNATYKIGESSKSALHIAVEKNNIEIVKLLLEQPEIDVNSISIEKTNKTCEKAPLHIAVEKNNIEIVKLLLEQPEIDVNSISIEKTNKTCEKAPLHIAVENKYIDIVQLLLEHQNIDVNLMYISKLDENDSCSKKNNNKIKKSALHIAIENNSFKIVTLLLDHPNIDIRCKYSKIIDDYNYLHSCESKNALHIAIDLQNLQIIEYLLSFPGIDVNDMFIIKRISNPLNKSKIYSEKKSKKYSGKKSKNKANMPKTVLETSTVTIKQTPLHLAIKTQNAEIVKLLLSSIDFDVNCTLINEEIKETNQGSYNRRLNETAVLQLAIENANIDIIQLLLSHESIDVNLKSKDIYESKSEAKEKDFSSSSSNINEKPPLFLAVERNRNDIVKLLIEQSNIDINSIFLQNNASSSSSPTFKTVSSSYKVEMTSIYLAVKNENVEIIKTLLSHPDIDVNIECKIQNSSSSKDDQTNNENHDINRK